MKPLLIQTLRTTLTASVVLMLAACPSHTSDKSDAKPHTRTANTAKPKAVVALALEVAGLERALGHCDLSTTCCVPSTVDLSRWTRGKDR